MDGLRYGEAGKVTVNGAVAVNGWCRGGLRQQTADEKTL